MIDGGKRGEPCASLGGCGRACTVGQSGDGEWTHLPDGNRVLARDAAAQVAESYRVESDLRGEGSKDARTGGLRVALPQ